MGGAYVDENGNPLPGTPGDVPMGPPPPDAPIASGLPNDPNWERVIQDPIQFAKDTYKGLTGGKGTASFVTESPSAEAATKIASKAAVPAPKGMAKEFDRNAPLLTDEPGADPGGGTDRSEGDKENERILHELGMWQYGHPSGAAAPYFQAEGASKAGIGGPELYNEAFSGAPGRRQQAMEQLGRVQEDRAKEMANLYDQQSMLDKQNAVAMATKAQADQEEIARRQQDLEKATKYYSRDLQDQGKFWANPGNIIAAISYSLLPIFSNDPTVGVKLINQAVQQDLDNRTRAADMDLSQQRAGLDGYRKIAGDRQAGDLLAQAEAHRIAAQEIARIGAKFGGPEAAAQMKVAIEDQKTRAAAAEMEFYAKYVHKDAKKTVPGETAALYRGPGGYAPGVAPTSMGPGSPPPQGQQGPASPANGVVGGGPSQASGDKFSSPVVKAIARTGGPAALDKLLSDPKTAAKVSDSDVEAAVKMVLMQRAAVKNPANPAKAYEEILSQEAKEMQPHITELQKTAQTRQLIASTRATMDMVERTELAHGKDPEQFLSWAKTAWPQKWVMEYEKFTAADPRFAANPAEASRLFREEKVKELRAKLQSVFNQHNHELFGGAQTAVGADGGEIGRGMMEVGNKSSFHQTRVFLDNRSQELQKQATEIKAGMTPTQRVLLRIRSDAGASQTYLPSVGVPSQKGPTK